MLTICSPTINIYVFLGYHLQINSFSGEQMHHSSIIKNVTIRHRIIFEFMPYFRLIVPTKTSGSCVCFYRRPLDTVKWCQRTPADTWRVKKKKSILILKSWYCLNALQFDMNSYCEREELTPCRAADEVSVRAGLWGWAVLKNGWLLNPRSIGGVSEHWGIWVSPFIKKKKTR